MRQYYSGPGTTAVGLGRNLRRQRLTEALAMAQGKMQPWNLPEMRPMVEATRAQTESQMRYLPDILARAGVSGPAAGLAIERTGEAGTNNLFNLMNQIRQQQAAQGLGLAAGEEQAYQNLTGLDLQRANYKLAKQQLSDQEKQAAWNRWMSAIKLGANVLKGGLLNAGGGSGGAGSSSANSFANSLSANSLSELLELLQQYGIPPESIMG